MLLSSIQDLILGHTGARRGPSLRPARLSGLEFSVPVVVGTPASAPHSTSELLLPAALRRSRVPTRPKVRDTANALLRCPGPMRAQETQERKLESILFFLNFIHFIFACTASSLPPMGCSERRATLRRQWAGFSLQRLLLQFPGSRIHGLSSCDAWLCCPAVACGIFPD